MLLKNPNPLVLAVVPPMEVETPSPSLRVPPVTDFVPPEVADHATPPVALCGSTMVTVPPDQFTMVDEPIENIVVLDK